MAPRLKGSLALLRGGLNGLDLRKPISVEKTRSLEAETHVDVIQHAEKDSEEPELLRDKTVKIINRTCTEWRADPVSSDDEFDRQSEGDSPDKVEEGWSQATGNEDWASLKKFERWVVFDGQRPQHEEQAKEPLKPLQVSTRMGLIMNRILGNLQKAKKT